MIKEIIKIQAITGLEYLEVGTYPFRPQGFSISVVALTI
jgi:hypothetical protein